MDLTSGDREEDSDAYWDHMVGMTFKACKIEFA